MCEVFTLEFDDIIERSERIKEIIKTLMKNKSKPLQKYSELLNEIKICSEFIQKDATYLRKELL